MESVQKKWAGHKFTLKSNMLTLDGISVEEVGLSQMHTEVEHNDLGPWMKSVQKKVDQLQMEAEVQHTDVRGLKWTANYDKLLWEQV